jgi:hypothetical protein
LTVRALILGLLGAAVIILLDYLVANVFELEGFISGGLLPVGVLVLMSGGAGVIALVRLVGRRGGLRAGELAVAFLLLMTACSVIGGAIQPTFTPALGMPALYEQLRPSWRKNGLLGHVPPQMLAGGGRYDVEGTQGMLGGLGDGRGLIPFSRVPWAHWRATLATWLPLIALAGVCMTCMSIIVHRQWYERERLRYPIAQFAGAMLSGKTDDNKPLYTNHMFIAGFVVVLAIFLINGLAAWYPRSIRIPMVFSLTQFSDKYPIFAKAPFADHLIQVQISVIAIAFSFFLSSEVSLSLGLSQAIFVPFGMWMMVMGVDLSSDYMEGGTTSWGRFGSYLAFAVVLLYFGRMYYARLISAALAFRRYADVSAGEAWSARVLVLAAALIVAVFSQLGMAWTVAVLCVGMMLLLYVIVARISAETGLFSIQARWQPLGVLLGGLGIHALGPKMMILVGLFCTLLTLNPGSQLMPFMVNSLATCSRMGVRTTRAAVSAGWLYALGIVLAAVMMIWINYSHGLNRRWDQTVRGPTMSFNRADRAVGELSVSGQLDQSLALSPSQRLLSAHPEPTFLWSAGLGFAAVILFSALRLRFSWWPLHPVMFLVWATWPMGLLSHSFFIGWLVRTIVLRLGGHERYEATKPLMIGAIAGNLVGAGFWMVFGLAYYAATGLMPPVTPT